MFRLHPSSQWYLSGGAQKKNNECFVCLLCLIDGEIVKVSSAEGKKMG